MIELKKAGSAAEWHQGRFIHIHTVLLIRLASTINNNAFFDWAFGHHFDSHNQFFTIFNEDFFSVTFAV